ncbi:hypothetical protein ACN47E_002145 [Coniothyrium glycines]
MPKWPLGTENIGFVGSVLAVDGTQTTAVVDYDAAVDQSALHLGGGNMSITFGPTVYAQAATRAFGGSQTASDAGVYKLRCEDNASDLSENRTCTASYGIAFGRQIQCPQTERGERSTTRTEVYTHTYSGRLGQSGGVETFTQYITIRPNTVSASAWCSDPNAAEPYVITYGIPSSSFDTFQLVLTAGLEKLNATEGASASMPGATPTASQVSGGATAVSGASSSVGPQQTTNAAPLVSFAPVLMGFGAVAAVMF